ncbi:MAG: PAS domain-containing protein [Novosphingobium sp.]|nr:PAS domain-containing protein [Novosphingobium sp.]
MSGLDIGGKGIADVQFAQAMAQTHLAICLCDPHQDDMPVVFANRAFIKLSGYEEHEILGRNCRFLQGPKSDRQTIARIRSSLRNEEVLVVEILNYRKDGSTFWNALHLGPVYNADGKLIYFLGSQWDVSDVRAARAEERHAREMARELSHRMKNMFAVIGGIVNFTGRVRGIETEAREINDRIQALGRAYETTLDDSHRGTVEVGQAIRAVLAPYDPGSTRIRFEGNGLRSDFASVSVLGLALHELAVNAARHGALSQENGYVTVAWQRNIGEHGPAIRIDWSEHGNPAADQATGRNLSGSDGIVDRMLDMARGGIVREWGEAGLKASLTIPLREHTD